MPTVITFDQPASIGERTVLIKALHLRGAMVWEISQDSDAHALISALSPLLTNALQKVAPAPCWGRRHFCCVG